MNVVDSSGWLEYLAEGPNADFFAPAKVKWFCAWLVVRRKHAAGDEGQTAAF